MQVFAFKASVVACSVLFLSAVNSAELSSHPAQLAAHVNGLFSNTNTSDWNVCGPYGCTAVDEVCGPWGCIPTNNICPPNGCNASIQDGGATVNLAKVSAKSESVPLPSEDNIQTPLKSSTFEIPDVEGIQLCGPPCCIGPTGGCKLRDILNFGNEGPWLLCASGGCTPIESPFGNIDAIKTSLKSLLEKSEL